jgi:bifunctional non-homologous end joining protein LigD
MPASRLPPFIPPMLTTAARELPADHPQWTAEAKWDGMRALAYAEQGRVRFWSRAGHEITAVFPELAGLAGTAGRRQLILDGEIVAVAGGRPDFSRLQRRMHVQRPAAPLTAEVPVRYVIFDLLHRDGRALLGNPYSQRRALLEDLDLAVPGIAEVPPAFPGEAGAVLAAAERNGLEGIVLKRAWSRYAPGMRSRDWVKIRLTRTADIVIGGWLPGRGQRRGLAGSVLAGMPGPAGLAYRGQVGSGFTLAELQALTPVLESLEQPEPPFSTPVPPELAHLARWTRPLLRAEVAYAELTPAGRFRQPAWRGLRAS